MRLRVASSAAAMSATSTTRSRAFFGQSALVSCSREESRRGSGRVVGLRIEREVEDEFVEPDDWALTLAVLLEEDDSQSGEPSHVIGGESGLGGEPLGR